jgi:hypothetical protein
MTTTAAYQTANPARFEDGVVYMEPTLRALLLLTGSIASFKGYMDWAGILKDSPGAKLAGFMPGINDSMVKAIEEAHDAALLKQGDRTTRLLKRVASRNGVAGYGNMTKTQLKAALGIE